MFYILRTISKHEVQTIVDYLNNNLTDKLGKDVSNYAPGRKRLWLNYEAPLSNNRPWLQGLKDEFLWDWIQYNSEGFEPDLGLISLGGGISRHRDASYAQFRAIGINLGKVDWYYEPVYPGFKYEKNVTAQPAQKFELTGGEVFEFNCKNPHWVENADPDRWAINLWKVSDKESKRFEEFKK